MKASIPWYSWSAKLFGVGAEPKDAGNLGWLAENSSSLVGLGASAGLSLIATSRSRDASQVATGWNLMAMPLGLPGAPSETVGKPPPLEKRTVTGILRPSKSAARVSADAAGAA